MVRYADETNIIQGISQLSGYDASGKSGRFWTSDVIGDPHVSFTMHLALRFYHTTVIGLDMLMSSRIVGNYDEHV